MAGEAGSVAARVELTHASYQKCSRTLERGEVKRVMQRGPLVGYFLACPACGFSASYLHDAVGYVEDPPTGTMLRAGERHWLVGIERPPACYKCRLLLRVTAPPSSLALGFLEAVVP